MADKTEVFRLVCEGGLDLRQDVAAAEPGKAIELVNYEPSIEGGYRRITGYEKFFARQIGDGRTPAIARIVGIGHLNPIDFPGEVVILVAFLDTDDVFKIEYNIFIVNDELNTSGDSWGSIDASGMGSTNTPRLRVRFWNYSFGAEHKVLVTGGIDPIIIHDSLAVTVITDIRVPDSVLYGCFHNSRVCLAGAVQANSTLLSISTPNNDTDFNPVNGAAVFETGLTIVGIHPFRDDLIIFGKEGIKKLTGKTSADFQIVNVANNIACVEQDTIQEVAGDLYFYSTDGIRSYTATERLGDVELGTVSRPINSILKNPFPYGSQVGIGKFYTAVPVRAKSQYRLFEYTAPGIIPVESQNPPE